MSPELAALCAKDLEVSGEQCQRVAKLALPSELPAARGNRYADDEEAAQLGFRIFYDARISNAEVRCATCHQPERYFADLQAVPEVIEGQPGLRNSPSILTAAWLGLYVFWDGRADSLWSQPLFALEHPDEMNSSRLKLAHVVHQDAEYRSRYEQVFGKLPQLEDDARFPAEGKPGDASFDEMQPDDREATNRIVANVGKALEAYMRKVAIGPGSLEQYLAGDQDALSPAARAGLSSFVKRGCIECHAGPALSDGKFHRIGSKSDDDPGRAAAIAVLKDNPFNLQGRYADPASDGSWPEPPTLPLASDEGAFKTPSLRAVALTAPYGHRGQYATLRELLLDHGVELGQVELDALLVFLLTLDGKYPERPWGDWPVL
jgi:cytochrome c peroxidase